MLNFILVWERSFYEDYGYDHTITTGAGILIIEANSLKEVEDEIKKYAGCGTGHRESVGIDRIEPCTGIGLSEPLSAIGKLLDPWGTRRR